MAAAARLVAVAAEAVHHAHQRGILHRDLKPANILVDEQGEPHVTDFGLAKRIDAEADLTHSGTLMGTPSTWRRSRRTSPGGSLDGHRRLRPGHDPLRLADRAGAVRRHHAGRDARPGAHPTARIAHRSQSKVPRDLEIICMKCLEKEPQRRYPSALALAEDLEPVAAGEPIVARPVGPVVRGGCGADATPC